MIIHLDLFSKQIWNILVFFDLYQSFEKTAMLKFVNFTVFPLASFIIIYGIAILYIDFSEAQGQVTLQSLV